MNRLYVISIIIVISVVLVSCKTSRTSFEKQPPERWMTIEDISGTAEVKETEPGKWQKVSKGQMIVPGSTIRTGSDSYILVKTNDNSAFELGNNTTIKITQFSETLSNPVIQIEIIEGGGFFAASQETLQKRSYSVSSPVMTASLVLTKETRKIRGFAAPVRLGNSGYIGSIIVKIEKGETTQEAATKVGVVSGNGTITLPGTRNSQQLQLEQYVEIDHQTSEVLIIPVSILEEAKKMGITNLNWFISMTTPTSEPTKTTTRTLPPVPATWTPFPTFDQLTAASTYSPLPTHLVSTPSPDFTPAPDGLTQAESANAGIHKYSAFGVAYGKCVYSGYGDENKGSFTFTTSGVTLASVDGGGSLFYAKISENHYQLRDAQQGVETTIIFYIDGWDMVVTKDGEACSHQTFLLK